MLSLAAPRLALVCQVLRRAPAAVRHLSAGAVPSPRPPQLPAWRRRRPSMPRRPPPQQPQWRHASSRRSRSSGGGVFTSSPRAVAFLRGALFTSGVMVGGAVVATGVQLSHLDDFPDDTVQEYEPIGWLRTLAQYNKFLVGPARTIERMWNDPAMHGFLPILAANLAVFTAWRLSRAGGGLHRTLEKYFLMHPNPQRLVPASMLLSTFSHAGPVHFMFNMYALWSFGAPMQEYLRGGRGLLTRWDYFALYCSAGTIASLTSLSASLAMRRVIPSLGASGAVFALASWVAWSVPDAQFEIIFLPFWPIGGTTLIQGLMAFDALGLILRWSALDHAAHLGGATLGYLSAARGDGGWTPLQAYVQSRRRLAFAFADYRASQQRQADQD